MKSTEAKQIAWQQLQHHQQEMAQFHLRDLFASDAQRFQRFSCQACDILLDFSKHHITDKTLSLLSQLAKACLLEEKVDQLFTGGMINSSEQRPALHTALRRPVAQPLLLNGRDIMPDVASVLAKMERLSRAICQGEWRGFTGKVITDVVNIGIGGSDLGPLMVTEALKPYHRSQLNLHFVANVDATHINETLKPLSPETTLFIVASKSFTTQETLLNALSARQWLNQNLQSEQAYLAHMIVTSNNLAAVREFGIPESQWLPIWEWVGGRYSVWSAVGLPIMLSVGVENFNQFLAGAFAMDQHFKQAPLTQNLPILLGLLGVWYNNFFHTKSHLILPYDQYMKYFATYIQQLEMESSGKSVTAQGGAVSYSTGPVIWGQTGCIGQHSFHQFLHQGTQLISADFIAPVQNHNPQGKHDTMLFANCLSQAMALMCGKTRDEAEQELLADGYSQSEAARLAQHKVVHGNRPSNMILFPKLTPYMLGSLIAMYEHKVFVQGCIWDINSFDQWGVELGKQITHKIFSRLTDEVPVPFDSSTNGLIEYYLQIKQQDEPPLI